MHFNERMLSELRPDTTDLVKCQHRS